MGGKNRKRYPEADLARGIGIILVVLGHALRQDGDLPAMMERMISVIYSFHMPLFFFLSGFVSIRVLSLRGSRAVGGWLRGRAVRLLVPYFFVSICYLPVKVVLSRYAQKPFSIGTAWRIIIGESPNTMLWYLYVLFLLCVISALLVRKKRLPAAIAVSLAAVFVAPFIRIEALSRLAQNGFYFYLGMAARIAEDTAGEGGGFLFGSWPTKRIRFMETIGFAVVFVLGSAVRLGMNREYDVLWGMLTALAGIRLTLAAAALMNQGRGKLCGFVRTAGKRSMDIYIMSDAAHTAVPIAAAMTGLGPWAAAAVSFAAGLVLPLIAGEYIVRRIPVLRLLVLGEQATGSQTKR